MKQINIKAESIPHRWEKMTFGQYVKYLQVYKLGWNHILAIFIDADPEEILKAKVEGFEVIISRLRFLNLPPEWDQMPTKLGTVTIPKDVTFESVEQFETMRRTYTESLPETHESAIEEYKRFAQLAAIYYQPIREGRDFDPERAIALMEEIYSLSCMEVVSVGRFFYAKLMSLRSGIPVNSLIPVSPLKKKKQGLLSSLRHLIFTRPSKYSRTAIFSSRKPS